MVLLRLQIQKHVTDKIKKKESSDNNACLKMERYRLELNLEGMIFKFEILDYNRRCKYDDDWLKINADFKFKDIINYHLKRYECLTYLDIDILIRRINDLLNDKLKNEEDFTPLEPDLHFVMSPKFDVRNNPNCIYVKPGSEIVDIMMILEVGLWDNGLTGNSFTMMFDRSEIEALSLYLHLIKGEVPSDDPKIQELIERKIICRCAKDSDFS